MIEITMITQHNKYYLELEAREAGESTLMLALESLHEETNSLVQALSPIGDVKPNDLLQATHSKLDKLTAGFDGILERYEGVERRESVIVLADFWTRCPELPRHIAEAIALSTQLLDMGIDKIRLRRRIESIEARLETLASKDELEESRASLWSELSSKSNRAEVEALVGKKASLGEIWKFREAIFKQLDAIKVAIKSGGSLAEPSTEDDTNDDLVYVGDLKKSESKERRLSKGGELLSRRFEVLNDHFGRVMEVLDTLVSRKELEGALTNVMTEMRALKTTIVEPGIIREKLAQKANAEDLQRLVRSLEKALGGRLDEIGEAAAVRCLVCDHPVSSASRSPISHYCQPVATFYDKDKSDTRGSPLRGAARGRGSPELGFATDDQRRDMQVLSHTLDLPAITAPGSAAEKYRARVRSSAGGGVGGNYTPDTR